MNLKLYIADENRLTKFNLPSEAQESFLVNYKPSNSKKEYTISIESRDKKWFLKSNGLVNLIQNGSIAQDTNLSNYSCHQLEIVSDKKPKFLYCIPSVEENLIDVSIFGIQKIIIGNSNNCNIFYPNNMIKDNHVIITNQNGKSLITVNETGVYLNEKQIRQSYLRIGDVIFIHGLKVIYMGNFLRINNPLNMITINGLQRYSDLSMIDNTNYEKVDSSELDIELYQDDEYFYHTPRIKNFITRERVIINDPPAPEKDNSLPFLLSMGSSLTMGASSLISSYTIIINLRYGNQTISSAIPSFLMCGMMLLGSVLMPRLTISYQKKQKKKKEKLRQEKYGKYLDEKEIEIKEIINKQTSILNENYPNVKTCCDIITSKNKKLWERNIQDEDFLSIRLGIGDDDTQLEIEASQKTFTLEEDNLKERVFSIVEASKKMKNVPILTNLKDQEITSIICEINNKKNYVNNIMMQLIAMHSAIDLKIVFLTDDSNDDYEYMKYLPHLWSEDKKVRFYANNLTEMKSISEYLEKELKDRKEKLKEKKSDSGIEKKIENNKEYEYFSTYYLIVTDCYKKTRDLSIINDVLMTDKNLGFSMLIIDDNLKDLPTKCKNFVYVKEKGSYQIESTDDNNITKAFEIEQILNYDMNYISSYLSNIPISVKKGVLELPKSLNFLEMYNVSKIEQLNILSRWKENDPTTSLKVPIGVHADRDLFILDLHEKAHGPHGLIAGSTGSGKSEFIITFVLSMAINYHPDEVAFVLIDYKGGGLAGAFENREKGISIPHLAGTITNLDTSEMSRTLVSINSELKRRQAAFNKARDALGEGTIDIYKYQRFYREGKVKKPIPHLFIISDEFAELKSQQPDFMDELISTARIGRSLGVHLILATQKPSGVVNDQIWANSKFKICLKVQDRSDSMEMLKRPEAASIKEPGRFYLQVGYDEYFDIGQSGWAGAKYVPSDRIIKKIDDTIEFIDNLGNVYKVVSDEEDNKKEKVEDLGEQLPNIVKYIVDLAKKQNIKTKMLWLSSIPDKIYVEGLKVKYNYEATPYCINPVIGEYDDPSRQEQGILTLDLTNFGNTVIYGMVGSGKENLLTTIIYTTCIDHSPEEVNFYILDFGAETLRSFAKYPHVGGVATIDDTDMIMNLFDMLLQELTKRKDLFSDYGGNYKDYINESGKKLPLIIIVINGYDVMNEKFPRLEDGIFSLLREGSKYGIVFVTTTSINNGLGYRASQMFINVISLQQKSDDLYRDITGCPRGLSPKKFFGRGIVSKNKTGYEFQTAYISNKEKINETIRKTATELENKYKIRATKIKTLPNVVELSQIREETTGLNHVAIGINKATLNTSFYNFDNLPVTMILSNKIFDNFGFVNALVNQFSGLDNVLTTVVDATGLFNKNYDGVILYKEGFDNAFKNIIMEVNKEGKDKNKRVFVFLGLGIIKRMLSPMGVKMYDLLFSNISRFKNSRIIIIDDYTPFQNLELESWYNDLITDTNGIWLGEGPTEQNAINFSNITREQKEEKFSYMAFTCGANGVILFKYVVEDNEANEDERKQSVS